MKKDEQLEAALARIREIGEPAGLAPFLLHKSNHVVAAAAKAIGRLEAAQLAPQLQACFEDLLQKPAARDPGCKALIAIATALIAMDVPANRLYFAGIRHIQKEGSFGPPVDVAAPLRGLCVRGLARTGHPDALYEIVNLLMDPEPPARLGAVKALAEAGRPEAELLLRLKLLQGDTEEVQGEGFSALLGLAPRNSLAFVAGFLRSASEPLREAAALALGESRLADALPILMESYALYRQPAFRRTLLLGIALLRLDAGVEFLLSRLENEPAPLALDALNALAIYTRDQPVRDRMAAIVRGRSSAELAEAFESLSRPPA